MALGRALVQIIPLDGGLNTEEHPFLLGTGEAQTLINIDLSKTGKAGSRAKRNGYTVYNTGGIFYTGTADKIHNYIQDNGNEFLLFHFGSTNLWYVSGGANVSITITGLGTAIPDMANFSNSVYICSSDISMQKWNGTTVSAVGGTPPANTNTLSVYKNRLWTANNSTYRSRLWYSALLNPDDWTTAGSAGNVNINAQDGDVIVKIIPQRERLVIFKERAIYALYGSNPTNFFWDRVTNITGCVSKNSVSSADGIIFFRGKDGFYMLGERDVEPILISKKIQSFVDNQTNTTTCSSMIYQGQYWVTYQKSGVTDGILVFDYRSGRWWEYRGIPNEVLYCHDNWTPYSASQGYGYNLDVGTTDNNGDISCFWKTPALTFGDITKNKLFEKINLVVKTNGTHTMAIDYWVDFEDKNDTISKGLVPSPSTRQIENMKLNLTAGSVGNCLEFQVAETSTYEFEVIGAGVYATIYEDI